MLDSIHVPIFLTYVYKWSLLTGKIWTCGHKKVAFGLTLQGGLRAQVKYIRKTVGASKLWSYMRGGL